MKNSGIIRRVDELGRIVLPIELRRMLDISEHDPVEISVEGDRIILHKHQLTCLFCGNADGLIEFGGKRVCRGCIAALGEADA